MLKAGGSVSYQPFTLDSWGENHFDNDKEGRAPRDAGRLRERIQGQGLRDRSGRGKEGRSGTLADERHASRAPRGRPPLSPFLRAARAFASLRICPMIRGAHSRRFRASLMRPPSEAWTSS